MQRRIFKHIHVMLRLFLRIPNTIKNGAYSGSAIIRDDILYVFYTGNVKYEGPYDFIHEGREHNVMRVESRDGITFEHKNVYCETVTFQRIVQGMSEIPSCL